MEKVVIHCNANTKINMLCNDNPEANEPEISINVITNDTENVRLEEQLYMLIRSRESADGIRFAIGARHLSFPADRLEVGDIFQMDRTTPDGYPIYIYKTDSEPLEGFPSLYIDAIADHLRSLVTKMQKRRAYGNDTDAELEELIEQFLARTQLPLSPIALGIFLHDQQGLSNDEIRKNAARFLLERNALEKEGKAIERLTAFVPTFLAAEQGEGRDR